MITAIFIVLALVLLFLFFSYPRRRFTPPMADVETPMGRTTLYHFRSKHRHGKGEIVMVHGFCENQMYFQKVADLLTSEGYDCLAINLFGYNGSIPNNSDYHNVEAYAKQIREALQEMERLRMIKNLVALWGHSMGATSLFLASNEIVLRHPELRGIFLENPGFKTTLSLFSRILTPAGWLASFSGPRRIFQFFVNLIFARNIQDPDAKQFVKRMLVDYAPTKSVATKNLKSIFQVEFSLEGISPNALKKLYFIFSQKDKLMNLKKVQKRVIVPLRSNKAFDESQLWVVPKVDHFISLQAPDQIAEFVIKQLKAKETTLLSESS